ncbi:MAG: cytochrome C [Haliscomenobacteraceae bacterium CHB4]|nr:hypothetical protein [Saprospiraceae bacterium]MCE7921533.1 cytochrome C [Haliscomenobacteraceae bacterium CHB4]
MQRKRILWSIVLFFVLIQFIRIDKINPPVDPKLDFATAARPPAEVLSVIKSACYDCHSDETRYPWYSNIAPVSWWIKNHKNEAMEHFNFSTLGILNPDDLKWALGTAADEIREKRMPLKSYTWMHPEARLSDEQRALLAMWLTTFTPVSTGWGEVEKE